MRKLTGVMALVALVGLAACGGGDQADESQEGDAMTPQPEMQQPMMDSTQGDTMMVRDTAGNGAEEMPQ